MYPSHLLFDGVREFLRPQLCGGLILVPVRHLLVKRILCLVALLRKPDDYLPPRQLSRPP